MFTPEQTGELKAPLSRSHVKEREQSGRTFSYIEGWHAIAEANRIFGFDAWDRETIELRPVWEGERGTRNGPKPAAAYLARVRVTVRAGEERIVREGVGTGTGFGSDVGEAHESAAKEAETDAMKRALITFGNPFGLALYDKAQEHVTKLEPEPARRAPDPAPEQPIRPTLEQRADALMAAIQAAQTPAQVNAAFARGSGLCAELDTADPEKLVQIEAAKTARLDDLSQAKAA